MEDAFLCYLHWWGKNWAESSTICTEHVGSTFDMESMRNPEEFNLNYVVDFMSLKVTDAVWKMLDLMQIGMTVQYAISLLILNRIVNKPIPGNFLDFTFQLEISQSLFRVQIFLCAQNKLWWQTYYTIVTIVRFSAILLRNKCSFQVNQKSTVYRNVSMQILDGNWFG